MDILIHSSQNRLCFPDRIEAYLNILEKHDSSTKRNVAKAKKSLTEHPKAKDLKVLTYEIVSLLDNGYAKIKTLEKYE